MKSSTASKKTVIEFPVDLAAIRRAREVAAPHIIQTQLEQSLSASRMVGYDLYLKFENRQRTGSFKIRGAANKLIGLTEAQKKNGIIAFSAGNHAQGVACMAQKLGIKAVIVMPLASPLVKVSATKAFGAEVHLHGSIVDESYQYMLELQKKENLTIIPPFDDDAIIAGQGTLGLELFESQPNLDTIFISIGGGGLCSGVALALKSLNPSVRIVGVQCDAASSMARWIQTGKKPSEAPHRATIADGIAVKKPSDRMYDTYLSKLVDEVVIVSEDEIAESMLFLLEREKTVVEGAGAASLAAAFSQRLSFKPKVACAILSGGNVDSNLIEKVVERGLQKVGRLVTIYVRVPDVPGSLTKLTSIISEKRANIIQIIHSRVNEKLSLGETLIEITLETTGNEHIADIKKVIVATGATLID